MAKCAICGKGPQFGQFIRHKHRGAWAYRAPRKKRKFRPNLQKLKVLYKGTLTRLYICTKCIKKGTVQKVV